MTNLIHRIDQSADEFRYLKSMLQAQYALLNASRNELNNITSKDIQFTLEKINLSLQDLRKTVTNAIDKLTQFQIECFTQVNASACKIISKGENAFKFILDKIAEHYEQASYLESVLNSRNESVVVLGEKLVDIAGDAQALDSMIHRAEQKRIERDADISTKETFEAKACPSTWGKTLYSYNTEDTILDNVTCSGNVSLDIGNDTMVPYCLDERIPVRTSERPLWNLASCSVDYHAKGFGRYESFIALMNTVRSKISASLIKVDIKRGWFDEAIFRNWEHFSLVSSNTHDHLVSIYSYGNRILWL